MLRSHRNIMRAGLALAAVTAGLAPPPHPAPGPDHPDGPKNTERKGDLRSLYFNYFYIFVSPGDRNNSVFILTMGPGAGIVGPSIFFPGAVYELHISNDGNPLNLTELVFQIVFSGPNAAGRQGYTVFQLAHGVQTILAQGVTNTPT